MAIAIDTVGKNAARKCIARLGGKTVTVHSAAAATTISTVVAIIKDTQLFGAAGARAVEPSWFASLLLEDVTAPRRGDRIVETDGTAWTLVEEQPTTDEWVSEWSVSRIFRP